MPYAGRWPIFAFTSGVLALMAVANAAGSLMIVAFTCAVLAVATAFVAGFAYRQRLDQLERRPRTKILRTVIDD